MAPADDFECLAVCDDEPDRVFLGTFENGVLRSTDAGQTFERVGSDTIIHDAVTSLAIDPSDPARILVGTEPSALFLSTDAGDTWSPVGGITAVPSANEWSFPPRPDTHHVRWIEIAPDDPDRWYVGIEAGALLVSPDGGDNWIDRPRGSRRDNHWIATHPAAPTRVYAAAGDGYAESHDNGETWTHAQTGLEHRYVWSVAVDPDDPDIRFVSAARGPHTAHRTAQAESYVYRQVDDTDWERLPAFPHGAGVVRPVLAAGGAPGQMYAATNRDILVTEDRGDEWTALPGASPETTPQDIAVSIAR